MASVNREYWKRNTIPGGAATHVIKKGYIEKRQRGRSNPESNTKKKFQRRFVELTKYSLVYYEKETAKDSRGEFSVKDIIIVEPVRDNDFHKNYKYFQIGNKKELMYFRVQTEQAREDWINTIRHTAIENGNKMLNKYHLGVYKKGRWSCCESPLRDSDGCSFSGRPERTVSMPVKHTPLEHYPHSLEVATVPSSLPTFQESSDDVFDEDSLLDVDRATSFSNSTGSIYSRDSGLGIEGSGKNPSLLTKEKEDNLKHGVRTHWKKQRKMTDISEIQYSSCAVNHSSLRTPAKSTTQSLDNFTKRSHYKYETGVVDVAFYGLDQIVIATKHEVHLQSTISELDAIVVFKDPDDDIVSLSTWRDMVAIKGNSKITVLSLETINSTITISSEPPCLADIAPDGASLIIAGTSTNILYSQESDRLQKISLHKIPVNELMPGHKPLSLQIHPDPREPYVTLLFPDELRNVLCLYIYNYKTKLQHVPTVCLGSILPTTVPHAMFSHYNLNIFVVYGRVLSMIDVTNSSMQQAQFNDTLDEVTCVQLTSVGRNIGVVLSNGDVLVFDGKNDHITQLYKMEVPSSTSALALSVNNKNMAIGHEDGELSLYERLPQHHHSEVMKMCSVEVTRNGKENVSLGHGISIDFPEGFIDEDKLTFNYAITAGVEFGPFELPNKGRLISSVLSLHPEKDVTFNKPISITMPHNLYCETDLIKGIKFCKAKVNDFRIVNGRKVLVFSEVSADENVSHFSRSVQVEEYSEVKEFCATLNTLHTCHYCLNSDDVYKQKVSDDSQLFLAQFKPTNLGKLREFYIDYVVVEFSGRCLQVLKEQYPDSEYVSKKQVFSFLPSHNEIDIKITNIQQLQQDGWKAMIEGREKISRNDLDFMDIPVSTLRCMCEQREFPPRFRIKMSAVAEGLPKKSELAVSVGGALGRICKNKEEPRLSADLLQSDVCLHETRREIFSRATGEWKYSLRVECFTISHSNECKESINLGDQSCEAQALQGCLIDIARAIPVNPREFCQNLFSGFIFTHSQVDKLTELPVTTEKEIISQNTEILFQVHLEISRNPRLFRHLCNVLIKMECKPLSLKLNETFMRIQTTSQPGSIQPQPMYSSTV